MRALPFHLVVGTLAWSQAPAADPAFQAWAGLGQDPAFFKAFAEARRSDPFVAGQEPYRTWLAGLLSSTSEPLRRWASVRLVEACAPWKEGEPHPEGYFLSVQEALFRDQVLFGNSESPGTLGAAVPWKALGGLGIPPPDAPCWAKWRRAFSAMEHPRVGLVQYALMAPRLLPEDGAWVMRCFRDEALRGPKETPWRAVAFWLMTDWLIAYGWQGDWEACAQDLPKVWAKALERVRKDVSSLPTYRLLAHVGRRGATDQDLDRAAVGADSRANLRRTSFLEPEYPSRAGDLGFSTTCEVLLTLNPAGEVVEMRPRPGYGLALFAPTAMEWMAKWKFNPAMREGKAVGDEVSASIRFYRPY